MVATSESGHRAHLRRPRRPRGAVRARRRGGRASRSRGWGGRCSARAGARSASTTRSCSRPRRGCTRSPPSTNHGFDRTLMLTLCALALRLDVLRYDAWHDPLTGLFDRRSFDRLLEMAISRSNRYGWPFTLVMLDLDHFKQINDQEGHPAGDASLRELGERFRRALRFGDNAARIGGDEFAMILPNTEADLVPVLLDRVGSAPRLSSAHARLLVRRRAVPRRGDRSSTSSSHLADRRLYEAKERGAVRHTPHDAERGMTDDDILDDLELELRKLPGVRAAGFDEPDDVLFVQLHVAGERAAAEPDPDDRRRVSRRGTPTGPVAVEIVRWRTRTRVRPPPSRSRTSTPPSTSRSTSRSKSMPTVVSDRRGRDAEATRDAPAAPARGARVPRHRRARGAPDARRSPHDRPAPRASAGSSARSKHASKPCASLGAPIDPRREVGRAQSTASGDGRERRRRRARRQRRTKRDGAVRPGGRREADRRRRPLDARHARTAGSPASSEPAALRTLVRPALVAQGIEHRPPEPCAQVRILPRARLG